MSRACLIAALTLLAGCAQTPAPPPTSPLVERDLMAQLAGLKGRRLLQESAGHTLALIKVSEPLPLHRHDASDEIVYVLEGDATMVMGEETLAIGRGDLVVIPRETPHAVTPGVEGVAAISIFTPPFEAGDRMPVE